MKLGLQRLGVENPDYKSPGPPGWGLNFVKHVNVMETIKKREAKTLHGL
jgi:hypothetical protein